MMSSWYYQKGFWEMTISRFGHKLQTALDHCQPTCGCHVVLCYWMISLSLSLSLSLSVSYLSNLHELFPPVWMGQCCICYLIIGMRGREMNKHETVWAGSGKWGWWLSEDVNAGRYANVEEMRCKWAFSFSQMQTVSVEVSNSPMFSIMCL